ncbi:PREDICTED: uncharacterized protein LOC105953717 [Erythranthe guttata]|uniref:uncharacterized protein LOC105953717 n=1 Tax=Erythranthe guttata TaxID=4155 RepID=UPI00064DBF8A|nr:PREDICTED: uncharacterized protein LOC105953717 [Erythranthe guttata]|eukprot:XP_012832857.1 PREDICTED: uncharacterized protein LOC105953717 [Erythranthe guttata]
MQSRSFEWKISRSSVIRLSVGEDILQESKSLVDWNTNSSITGEPESRRAMSEEDIFVDHIGAESTGTDVIDLEFDDMGIPLHLGGTSWRWQLVTRLRIGIILIHGTWKLPENEATKKLFNETANGRWKDAKTKRLNAVFDRAPDLATAKANCPNKISAQTWEKLCDQCHSISTPGVDGKSKSTKCKDSRKKVSTDHHWGRTSINSWSHNHFKKFGKSSTVFDTYKKAYMGIDAPRETRPNISEE